MKGKFNLDDKFDSIDSNNLFISEIIPIIPVFRPKHFSIGTELKYGVEKSDNHSKNKKVLENFLTGI